MYPKGVGGAGLARYLQEANKEVEVWLQVGVTLSMLQLASPAGRAVACQGFATRITQHAAPGDCRCLWGCACVFLSHGCQVETKGCLEAMDDVLSVPGITCAFLGPADMGLSLGYHVKHNYDLPAMLASSDMEPVYTTVVEVRAEQAGSGWCVPWVVAADVSCCAVLCRPARSTR